MAHRATKGSGADFISALCFMIFGAALAVAALKMRVFNNSLLISPGLFPLILGGVFLVLGFFLLRSAAKRGGRTQASRILGTDNLRAFAASPKVHKGMTLLAFIVVYVMALGHIPFMWATAAYLIVTFTYLKAMKLHWNLLLAVASAWAISFAFSDLFRIPMP